MKMHLLSRSRLILIAILIGLAFATACGGGSLSGSGSPPPGPPSPPPPSANPGVILAPTSVSLTGGLTQQFTATVSNLMDKSVAWSVNGVVGGNANVGTISATGLYTAPLNIPSPNPVEVKVVCVAKPTVSATGAVTVGSAVPVLSLVTPDGFQSPANFTLTITGKNFVNGAVATWNSTTLQTTFVSSTQLVVSGNQPAAVGAVPLFVINPGPGSPRSNSIYVLVNIDNSISAAVASRVLHQISWGGIPQTRIEVRAQGIARYIDTQFGLPMTTYAPPFKDEKVSDMEQYFFNFSMIREDQLRQRVAFALSQITVASANKVNDVNAFTLWQNMLQKDAFGNYYDLLKDVTLSPVMGNYLDMVNNDKPNLATGTSANENYAREVLQLFSVGLNQLNPDGTLQLDGSGNPIPTYSQDTITNFARVFTGWTYPPKSGSASFGSSPNYTGPMVPIDSHHDTDAKTLLNGVVIPAGGTAQADMDAALQNIFNHPNVGPFICKQLIQHLVTSNPSPQYVNRIVAVFNNNGSGVRGDLKAVVRAILLDTEARRGDDPTQVQANDGHLKEPVLLMMNMLRAMRARSDGESLPDYAATLKQEPLNPPSVFNYYHPGFVINGTNLLGPEFEIFNTSTTISRINFINTLVFGKIGVTMTTDLSEYLAVASSPDQLVDKLNDEMMDGQMSSDARTAIINAISGISDNTRRVKAALYLVGSSSQFQVSR